MTPAAAYPFPPRVLRREAAAYYVGLSPRAFDQHPERPAAIPLGPRTPGWKREDLDAMVDRIAGTAPALDEDYAAGY